LAQPYAQLYEAIDIPNRSRTGSCLVITASKHFRILKLN